MEAAGQEEMIMDAADILPPLPVGAGLARESLVAGITNHLPACWFSEMASRLIRARSYKLFRINFYWN
jgi:hypothetical protein